MIEELKYCLFFGGYFFVFLHVYDNCLNIYLEAYNVLDLAKLLGMAIILLI